MSNEAIIVKRNCEAILIPSGQPITIETGSTVWVTQLLGGSCTVRVYDNLARIAGKNFDALGLETTIELPNPVETEDGMINDDQLWAQMRTCYDPEIPVNIVDLGLIYDCLVTPQEDGGNHVYVKMTLTSAGCGMGTILVEDVRSKVLQVPNVTEVEIDLVFDPPWSLEMMSDEAKLQMGMY